MYKLDEQGTKKSNTHHGYGVIAIDLAAPENIHGAAQRLRREWLLVEYGRKFDSGELI